MLFVENQSISDYYKGEAAILYAFQSPELFQDYFATWQKELRKGTTPPSKEFNISNYLSDASDTAVDMKFDYLEKCFILNNSDYKVSGKIDVTHPFFRVNQKLSKTKYDLYFDYFSSFPLKSDSTLHRYHVHNEQILSYKNDNLVLTNSENSTVPIATAEESEVLGTGEETKMAIEESSNQDVDILYLPVALSMDSNSRLVVKGDRPIELSGLFHISGEINLEQSLI